ncbi:hypothetical protein TWF281_004922 [Arthrobotrys megalospora]
MRVHEQSSFLIIQQPYLNSNQNLFSRLRPIIVKNTDTMMPPKDIVPAEASTDLRDNLFPHPTDRTSCGTPIRYREKCMREFSSSFRDDPNWISSLEDRPGIAAKLREAYIRNGIVDGKKATVCVKDDAELVLKELAEHYKPYVEQCKRETGKGIEPDIDGVWRGDGLIDDDVRAALIEAVKSLENVPENEKLWHHGSNGTVQNLVHPSYWPIVYGRTITSNGDIIKPPAKSTADFIEGPDYLFTRNRSWEPEIDAYSKLFCWLPSEFEISDDGKKVKIGSYINNLATEEHVNKTYPIIENIFSKFLPLFNHVLAELREERHNLSRIYWDSSAEVESELPFATFYRLQMLNSRSYNSKQDKKLSKLEEDRSEEWEAFLNSFGVSRSTNGQEPIAENATAESAKKEHRWSLFNPGALLSGAKISKPKLPAIRGLSLGVPKPQRFHRDTLLESVAEKLSGKMWSAPNPKVLEKVKLEGRTAKVIVKLSNIVLTPERPKYNGGHWHTEAMKNERIVATGIYYYQQENITESKLGFRRPLDMNRATTDGLFDFNIHDETTQEIGSTNTKENRAIAFPNIYQHKVEPFELVDKTKPGYRKVLVFFLCDPSKHNSVPTTRTVPPQQPNFRKTALEALPLEKLPIEIFYEIKKHLPPPISKEEALEYYHRLMEERTGFGKNSPAVNGYPDRRPRACD